VIYGLSNLRSHCWDRNSQYRYILRLVHLKWSHSIMCVCLYSFSRTDTLSQLFSPLSHSDSRSLSCFRKYSLFLPRSQKKRTKQRLIGSLYWRIQKNTDSLRMWKNQNHSLHPLFTLLTFKYIFLWNCIIHHTHTHTFVLFVFFAFISLD
jgi:hypothetical protein